MKVVTISTSQTAAKKAVSEIQAKLIKDGFVNISNAVFLKEVGGLWTVQVIPAVLQAMNWTMHIDLNAMLEAQGHLI
jgi:virulence-associated protein VapD